MKSHRGEVRKHPTRVVDAQNIGVLQAVERALSAMGMYCDPASFVAAIANEGYAIDRDPTAVGVESPEAQ